MAVEAVVSVVLQKLTEMLKVQSVTQNKFIIYEVQEIMKSLNSMRDLMISTKAIDPQAKQYLNAIYNVEDTIEKFTVIVVRQKKVFGFLTNHIFFFNNFNSCKKIHHKIKKITTQLMQLNAHTSYQKIHIEEILSDDEKDEETPVHNHISITGCMEELTFRYSCNQEEMQIVGVKERFQKASSFSYKEEELGIFGLKNDVEILVTHLTRNNKHFVSIFGQGGIGKTTLARIIYKRRNIKRHFQFRAWVSILERYTTKDILLSLLKATDKAMKSDDEKEMKSKLSETLVNKRYLIVLDGVNTRNIWKDIKEIFSDVKNGSKVVITSKQTMETIEVDIVSHLMVPLSKDDTLKMFKKKVGKEESWHLITEASKKAILQRCNGLPLNVILLAGLFSTKDSNSWSQVFSCVKKETLILSICYNDLTEHLKVCLLYSVLFPKEFDIPVRRLLRLWLAEGFVKQNSTNIFLEDIAQTYFEELVNRNMIQVSKLRSDSSPRRCRVVGVLHDYLLPKAHETNLFYTYRNLISYEEVSSLNVRRMVEYESPKKETRNQFAIEMSKKTQPKNCSFNPSRLWSYMSFNHQKTDYRQAKRIRSFLGNIINNGIELLRVLDLEGVYKPILPENLGNLCNLRYLGLRSTYLENLPSSIGELTLLETLDIKHTCIDELPGSVWRLKNLQHLNLNETCLNMQPHASSSLLTLWELFLDIRCCDRLSNIPTTLLQQQKLEKVVLTGMPDRFTAEVERLKSDHTSMTINHWKYPPLPWEQDDTTLVKSKA